MNEVWDLSPLYKDFDDAFEADLAALKEAIDAFGDYVKTLSEVEPVEGLREGVRYQERILDLADRLGAYPRLRQSTNTRDTEARSQLGRIQTVTSSNAGTLAAFRQWAVSLPDLQQLVASDELLKEYTFYFDSMVSSARYQLPGSSEELLAKLAMSGSGAWGSMRGLVTSTAKVQYWGTETNLSAIRNLARDPDPTVRKEAYEAELASYEAVRDPVAHAMNAIKLETITECKLRGYESPLDASLKEAKLSRATLDAMLAAVEAYLPKFRSYMRAKARALGHTNGLPWYDLNAPMGTRSGSYTTEQARDMLLDIFGRFDGEIRDLMATAFEEAWIDFFPRSGKRDGAFCSSSRSLGRSWIMTNYSGKLAAVATLAHELGHAFHNRCIHPHRPLNKRYGRPLAETASTFNECVFYDAAIAGAKDAGEKLGLIEGCLISEAAMIVDIYSRFLFEDEVFRRRENEFLSADDLCDIMARAQRTAYGDGLDPEALHPYMWVCKPHYYSASYYNYPYIFGDLFSRGLYARYKAEGESFVAKYKKLLYTTTVASVEDTAAVAGIDLTDKAFWMDALQGIADMVDEFIQLTEG